MRVGVGGSLERPLRLLQPVQCPVTTITVLPWLDHKEAVRSDFMQGAQDYSWGSPPSHQGGKGAC